MLFLGEIFPDQALLAAKKSRAEAAQQALCKRKVCT